MAMAFWHSRAAGSPGDPGPRHPLRHRAATSNHVLQVRVASSGTKLGSGATVLGTNCSADTCPIGIGPA